MFVPRILTPLLIPFLILRKKTVYSTSYSPPLKPTGSDAPQPQSSPPGSASEADPSSSRFILMLRTFGHDGDTLIGNSRDGIGFKRDTIESIIARTVKEKEFGVYETWALHDAKSPNPNGVRYLSTPNDKWEHFFRNFSKKALAIVIISKGMIRPSFAKELEYARKQGFCSRVVVVFPEDLSKKMNKDKAQIFRKLGWEVPPAMPLVAWRPESREISLAVSYGPHLEERALDRYTIALRMAFKDIIVR